MYCEKCGKQLSEDSLFCQYCGYKFVSGDTTNVEIKSNDSHSCVKEKKLETKRSNKTVKIIVITTVILVFLGILVAIGSALYDEYIHEKESFNTPEETYDVVYDWLIDNGRLVDGETLVYSEERTTNGTYKIRAYERSDNILFAEILVNNYRVNGKSYDLSVRLDLMPSKLGTTRMYVTLESTSNRAYCTKTYSIDVDAFRNNVPISGGDVECSNNTPAFNFTYTDEEKAESLKLLEEIEDQSYGFLIEILNWLSSEYAPKVSLSIKDFGYTSYESK